MQLLDKLIPGFEERACVTIDITGLCAPVCLPSHQVSCSILSLTYLDTKLQLGANHARSDDTCQLQKAIVDWINDHKPLNKGSNFTSRLSEKWKEERGISSDITGRLLCPIDYDWDDPKYVSYVFFSHWDLNCACRVCTKLREAAEGYDFNANFLLRCLYDGENRDPQNPGEGFLKGPLLLCVSQLCSPFRVHDD